MAQWNTAEPRPSRQNKGQDFFRCWGQGVAWHASKDRVPRMPYPPNSGCIRHVLACPSSTPSECWRLPPRLESTPGLKLISLPLHNNAAASPGTSSLRLRRTCSALLGWAPEPQNSGYLPSQRASASSTLPGVNLSFRDWRPNMGTAAAPPSSEARMLTGGGAGGQELRMGDRWQPGAGVWGRKQLHIFRVR